MAVEEETSTDAPVSLKKLPSVPEYLLKRRKKASVDRVNRLKSAIKAKKERHLKKKEYFKRAETYIKEYRAKERDEKRIKKNAKKAGNFYVPEEPKLGFAIRIRGINGIAPKPRKVLQLLRLLQINNGIFFKINKATLSMIKIAEPYITWGYPNLKTIRDLVYKRGFMKIAKRRIPIVSNELIEHKMKRYDIICIEDLVHEIHTVGPNFREATHTLWPFKLNTPTGGWRKKTRHFVEGGDYGNREIYINKLLRRMI